MKAELRLDRKAILGEGSIWDPLQKVLWWIDIEGKILFRFHPDTDENREFPMPARIGTVVPRESSGLVVALENGFFFYDPDTQLLESIADPEADKPEMRFNDGKCDPQGRFWAGTMRMGPGPGGTGALYCLYPDKSVKKRVDGVTISNGICWSLDATTLYYVDTPTHRVDAFDYDNRTGEISGRRALLEIDPDSGSPDGMTIDQNGNLWIAHWGGSRVTCWNPDTRKQLEQVDLPVSRVTSCAFGGPRLDTLYITTASVGFKDSDWECEPHAGSVFQVQPGVSGISAYCFSG